MTHENPLTLDVAEKLIRKSGPWERGLFTGALLRRFANI